MRDFLSLFIGIVIASMVVLLCFSSCFVAGKSDEYWEKLREELEKKKNERR